MTQQRRHMSVYERGLEAFGRSAVGQLYMKKDRSRLDPPLLRLTGGRVSSVYPAPVAKEITGRVYGFTRGVATVCCLHRFKNALTVLIYCLLNRRAGDNVKDRRCCQALFPCACLGLRCNDVLHPGRVVYSV